MADDFEMQLKSTLDKVVADKVASLKATYPKLSWAEVDDMAQTDAVFKSLDPAIIWSLGTVEPSPRPPLYSIEFMVGAKTAADPGNYLLIKLLGEIRSEFEAAATVFIYDYTLPAGGPVDTQQKGFISIISNETAPQQFDKQSGIRYAVVAAKAVKYG